ncbi:Oidioi.mRNA.OKI2018_I69.chr2.g5303.t1.cds [Oikopleura dioica]|uniref:Oidioi.mRNA.OKI2018_I69.chr2.g5303.t1.cds n=1 Tax=Oikopleura dioica TaxID=34765 RepID=A0ABN7T015_OIKDI|nr:Oidioi.mRNA.OKI2018_I69.chr2.g5303.t1.cds [Oikopleura dioica]
MNFLAMQNANISMMPEEEELIVDEQETIITTPEYEENFNGIMKLKRGPRRRIYAGEKCSVCGADGTGFNYGALTCNPCKSFFRRTILENNLSQHCEIADTGKQCDIKLRRFCAGCRLRQCLDSGMRANYVRELNMKRMKRRVGKLPAKNRLSRFSEILDPFQENFLSIVEGFWLAYRDFPMLTNEQSLIRTDFGLGLVMLSNDYKMVHKTTQDAIVRLESRFRRFKLPDPNIANGLAGLEFIKDLINHHVLLANLLLSMLPNTRWQKLTDHTKRRVLVGSAIEISLMRFAARYSSLILEMANLPEIPDALFKIAHRCGLSESFVKDTLETMGMFAALGLDSYEESLLASVAAVSPDRGIETEFDFEILSALQETMMMTLRIKFHISERPESFLGRIVAFLTRLRKYAHEQQPLWEKFIYHRNIIMTPSALENKPSRCGIDYICQSADLLSRP